MQVKHHVQDSHSVEEGARLLGKVRAWFYIGAAVLLVVIYVWFTAK